MMRHETQAWCGVTLRGTSRQQKRVPAQKEVLLILYYLDNTWYYFIKNIYNSFQNLLFRKLLAQLGNQTDIFWKFYSPADILWSPKTVGRVLGYNTDFFNTAFNILVVWHNLSMSESARARAKAIAHLPHVGLYSLHFWPMFPLNRPWTHQ